MTITILLIVIWIYLVVMLQIMKRTLFIRMKNSDMSPENSPGGRLTYSYPWHIGILNFPWGNFDIFVSMTYWYPPLHIRILNFPRENFDILVSLTYSYPKVTLGELWHIGILDILVSLTYWYPKVTLGELWHIRILDIYWNLYMSLHFCN